jgi:hypothetical protein
MFRVRTKDDTTNNVFIQGARSTDSVSDIACLVFQNYDFDDAITHNMASICLKDHYGTVNQNGFGDLVFKTAENSILNEHMRINYSGNIGIGINKPEYKLHVAGTTKVTTLIADNIITNTISTCNITNPTVSSLDEIGIFFAQKKVSKMTDVFVTVASMSTQFKTSSAYRTKLVSFTTHLEPNSNDDINSSNFFYNVRLMDVTSHMLRGSYTYSNSKPKYMQETIAWNDDDDLHNLDLQVKKNSSGLWISMASCGIISL